MAKKKKKKKGMKKRVTEKSGSRKPEPPSDKEFTEAIQLSCEAQEALGKKILKAQKFIVSRPGDWGPHRHREPTQQQVAALSAAIDTASAATTLCASLHPQGCPPHLQHLTLALDEAHMLLCEAQRYAHRSFRGDPPQVRNRGRY